MAFGLLSLIMCLARAVVGTGRKMGKVAPRGGREELVQVRGDGACRLPSLPTRLPAAFLPAAELRLSSA